MHLLIAREAVDQHLKVAGDLLEPDVELTARAKSALQAAGFYSKWLPQLLVGKGQSPATFREFGELADHLRFAERHARKLARAIFYGMTRWQARMERKQVFLGRVVDIGAELFAIAATVVYAKTLESERPAERAQATTELADLFCIQSRRRIEVLFEALWHNDDDASYEAAQRLLEGRYAWVEEGIVDSSDAVPLAELARTL